MDSSLCFYSSAVCSSNSLLFKVCCFGLSVPYPRTHIHALVNAKQTVLNLFRNSKGKTSESCCFRWCRTKLSNNWASWSKTITETIDGFPLCSHEWVNKQTNKREEQHNNHQQTNKTHTKEWMMFKKQSQTSSMLGDCCGAVGVEAAVDVDSTFDESTKVSSCKSNIDGFWCDNTIRTVHSFR